jgi:fatty acid desaturase
MTTPTLPNATRPALPRSTRPAPRLTPEELEAFGAEMDAIRARVLDDLGERDLTYIRTVVKAQRGLAAAGRGLLFASFLPPAWIAGTAALSISKILDNMEIGHNVMHGQYDWTRDPALQSSTFEWDTAGPSDQWRHSHNYLHHTFTNVLGKDRDIGYGLLRMDEAQRWTPANLLNPINALGLALLFEFGVGLHDVEIVGRTITKEEQRSRAKGVGRKVAKQSLKDYVVWPLLTGPSALTTLTANATANVIRNLWTFSIIFCGHFPEGVHVFTEDEVATEGRGGWYYRQLLGSANITGGKLFHVMSGNLSHQIEHHLFPDLPAHRYAEISTEVRAACERYGLPYNARSFSKQFGSVVRKIFRLALPNRAPAGVVDTTAVEAAPAGAAALAAA